MVAFFSEATTLVDGDTNGREDVFVAGVASGEIQRVNLNQLGIQADIGFTLADRPSLSEDGRLVAFADSARLTDDAPAGDDALVYQRDLEAGATSYVAEVASPRSAVTARRASATASSRSARASGRRSSRSP